MKHSEINKLKQTFGDNWKEGMRKHPEIDRVSEHEMNEHKSKLKRENERKKNKILLEGIQDSYKRGKVSKKMMEIAHNMLKD